MSKTGFKELIVWQRAKTLAVTIYELTDHGSMRRDYGLTDQMRRSAVSVPSNIAEGDERGTDKESVRHFFIAKGSLAELLTQLEIAKDVGLASVVDVEPIAAECTEVGKMLGALIKARRHSILRSAVLTLGVGMTVGFLLPLIFHL